MEWHDIKSDGRRTVKFTDLPYVPLMNSSQSSDGEEYFGQKLGGIIRHGEWAWLVRNSVLQIVSLRNGQTISSYEFCQSRGYENCCIKYVEEIFSNNPELMLLAIILESFRSGGSYVVLYSIELSSVLSNIEFDLHITCARFMDSSACHRTLLRNFDGCLVVGSEEGVIVILDLNLQKLMSRPTNMQEDCFVPCHIVDYNLPIIEIHRNFRQCQLEGIYFGLRLEVIESPCSIQSILPINLILGLAIGLEDGRLVLYDLAELQIFYVALPKSEVAMSALVKMDFLEPPDDPRPCLYIWALHENGENLHAVLHSLMYEKRFIDEDGCSTYFEIFQTGLVRLQLPLEATKSVTLGCQAISTLSSHDEDDSNCLCIISWLSVLEGKNKLLIFDLNQWYKEEMPLVHEYGKQPNYLAGYILNGECTGLHTILNPDTISHFNSMQRFEEHFYPNSLSFECSLLHTEGCRRYNWEGVQNRVVNILRASNSAIFLEPNFCFNEIIRTRLMPQFIELNINSTFSTNAKYEILLSTALEHNCISLLRDCAKSWVDGSFMGNFSTSTGLSLSTITDWIWKRAACIKARCNDLCKSLFEIGGYPLDNREQRELGFITRQLKLLSDLMKEILLCTKKQIPERVYLDLENKYKSLCMASSYQDILLWLFNIGLLPEASPHNDKINVANELVPYPYKELKELYRKKRSIFAKINESFISKKTGSCKLLYIDSFIDHACKGNILHEYWLENDGDGLYPPNTLEAMLRVMLVPDLDYDNKYAILLYFFLDLNMSIDEEVYKNVAVNFIKFPSVFKLSASLIKTVQAFWNLDHDHYLPAVNEFISPFNKNQSYPQWQVELLIEVLLNQNASNLALRILESQPSLISPFLNLKTLLANELISEAFHFVRLKNDDSLLETFFTCCLKNGQFGVIRDLALNEREGLILQNILKKSKTPGAESLHFVYLLQKSKYIEAVSYMDELTNKSKIMKSSINQISQVDTPNLVLSAFNTTMTPITQGLTDVYFRIKNKIKKKEVDNKSPVPLSCQLIKQNANNLLGGIYHSSALSAHFATYYWGEMEEKTKQAKHLLSLNNAPFLRRPQIDTNCIDYLANNNISYPLPYKISDKRTMAESELFDNDSDNYERHKVENNLNPKKKRRLVGQEIINDLSHFMKINKTSNNSNVIDFQFGPEQNENTMMLLTQPTLVKAYKSDEKAEEKLTTLPEIHGILKTNTTELGVSHRGPTVEEEKNLRFRLPSADVTEEIQDEEVIEEIELRQELVQEKEISIPKFRQITRAVSEESNKSSVSSNNHSEESFYSPLSSKNNSKLDCSSPTKYSFMSGPQPRKPLARLSAERSEKSLTPEPETKKKIIENTPINNPSNWGHVTSFGGVSSRRSIGCVSSERLKSCAVTEDAPSQKSSNIAYVTALDTLTSRSKDIKTGSTFESLTSHTTFAGSKISEFLPKVSSSKVVTIPVEIIVENKPTSPTKLFECSTVVGSLNTFECTNIGPKDMSDMPLNTTKVPSYLNKPTEEQKRQMLDTTLDMSSFDFSNLESTSLLQNKSSSMLTPKDAVERTETSKEEVIKNTESGNIKEAERENDQMECDEDGPILQSKVESQYKNEHVIAIQTKSNSGNYKEDTNDDCIILSSASSSPSLKDQEEYENSNTHRFNNKKENEIQNNNKNDKNFTIMNDNEDLTIDETENTSENDTELSFDGPEDILSDTENEMVIQLIEDSSSDIREEQANYLNESDSDDVKVLEDENADGLIGNIKMSDMNSKIQENELVEMVTPTSSKNPTSTHVVEQFVRSSENIFNEISDVDIQINESISTSTTEISSEKMSEFKTKESKCGDTSVKKGEKEIVLQTNEEHYDECANNLNKVEMASPIVIDFENKSETDVEKVVSNVESENVAKKISKVLVEETTTLRMEDSMDCSDIKIHKKPENDSTLERETSEKIDEKSEKCNKTEVYESSKDFLVKKVEKFDLSVPHNQRTLRGSSVPHVGQEAKDIVASSPRRNTRGISAPPQTIRKSENLSTQSPRSRRNLRARSLQPKCRMEENTTNSDQVGSANKNEETYDEENPVEKRRSTRGSSVPPGAVTGKISTRRRSTLLEAINEDPVTLDSPSSRTRLKIRLNSIDSELDSPIPSGTDSLQLKRTRRTSMSSNISDLPLTPKRSRRNSTISQQESNAVHTPRSLRARSVLSVQEEEEDGSIPDSPKPAVNKRIGMKRRKNIAEEKTSGSEEHVDQISPNSDHSVMSEASYSNTRRLTRTQLAIMVKSVSKSQTAIQDAIVQESTTITSQLPLNKRIAKSRSTNLSNDQVDTDDGESVSSKLSNTSTKRRVTRNSIKEKDEIDDEVTSVASSVGSEKPQRPRRSKEKSSPTTLSVIPEDEPVQAKKRGRSTKN